MLLTTLVLPVVSIAVDYAGSAEPDILYLIGKWFVFWGVGIRLLLAGASQALKPSATSAGILGIKDPAAEKVVSELGYANLCMGLAASLSLLWPAWMLVAGMTGGLYLGLAGVKHVFNKERNAKENLAMATDFLVFAVVAVFVVVSLTR